MIDDLIKAWAAGFFDGEGSIRIYTKDAWQGVALSVDITQVDKEPIDRLNTYWPGRIYYVRGKDPTRRPTYRWKLHSKCAARFLKDIRPFICRPKVIERIDLAIKFQAQKRRTSKDRFYRNEQHKFLVDMKRLNARGRAALQLPPQRVQIEQQLKMLFDSDDLDKPQGEG